MRQRAAARVVLLLLGTLLSPASSADDAGAAILYSQEVLIGRLHAALGELRAENAALKRRLALLDAGSATMDGVAAASAAALKTEVFRLVRKEGGDGLILFALTTTPPTADQEAVEVPDIEKQRAGLDRDERVWLILDEYNYDVVGESYYLEPVPPLGRFSKAFFAPLLVEVSTRLGTIRRVARRG